MLVPTFQGLSQMPPYFYSPLASAWEAHLHSKSTSGAQFPSKARLDSTLPYPVTCTDLSKLAWPSCSNGNASLVKWTPFTTTGPSIFQCYTSEYGN